MASRIVLSLRLVLAMIPAAASLVLCAQSQPAPQAYVPKRMDTYIAYTALWRTDSGFHSTIKIANQLSTSEIDVIPVIYMADGTPWQMPRIHLGKSAIKVVDINKALAQAPDYVRPHLSAYGSAAVGYRYDWQGAVYSTVSILNLAKSLEYNYPFIFPPRQGTGQKFLSADLRALRDTANGTTYEGLWFRNSHNAGGFLALSNTSNASIDTTVALTGIPGTADKRISLPAHNTQLIDLLDLFGPDEVRTGGITVRHSGHAGDLQLAGGLEDSAVGYSTNLPFSIPKAPTAKAAFHQYASPGMMINEQSSMMNFPAGIHFWPYAFFRNVGTEPRNLQFLIYYMQGKTVRTLVPGAIMVEPGEAKELPLRNALASDPDITDVTLVTSYSGYEGDILSATGSTDTSGSYVFPVLAEPIAPSGIKKFAYWQNSGGFDTMYSIWNPLPRSQTVLATISYGADGKAFKMPITLASFASTMVDIGELVKTQTPDRDGNTIPLTAAYGSFAISAPSERPEAFITAAISSGIYNPTKGTCGSGCETCSGISLFDIFPDISITGLGFAQARLTYTMASGGTYDVTSSTQWSIGSTKVATVQTTGQSTPGQVQGVAPGSTDVDGYYSDPLPVNYGQLCANLPLPPCPTEYASGNTPVTDSPTVTISGPTSVFVGSGIALTANGSPSGGSYSWKSSNADVTLANTSTATVAVAGTTAGTATVTVTYTMGEESTTASTSVTVSSAPDHVSVIVDQEGFPAACPTTGVYVRQMEMQVVDTKANAVTSNPFVQEVFQSLSSNSCGNGNAIPAACAVTNKGVGGFLDTQAVSGNLCGSGIKQSSGCGFTLTSVWSVCQGSTKQLWNSPRVDLSNSDSTNGSTSAFQPGTQFH